MFKKMLCKVVSVIRRINQWWDRDEEKAIITSVSGIIILFGILILHKLVIFVIALILISNRVLHRCNIWTMIESDVCEDQSTVFSSIPKRNEDDEKETDH